MSKRITIYIIAVICVVLLPAKAITAGITGGRGQLNVKLEYNGATVSGVAVSICRVATIEADGGGAAYSLIAPFDLTGTGYGPESMNSTDMTAASNQRLADIFSRQVNAGVTRWGSVTDARGIASFSELVSGMYLITQDNSGAVGYSFAPLLVPVPYQTADGWSYDVTAQPKGERTPPPVTPPPVTPPAPPPPAPPPTTTPPLTTSPPPPPTTPPPPPVETTPESPTDSDIPEDGPPREYFPPNEPPPDDSPPAPDLPQTGAPRWPVPVLSGSGIISMAIGICICRKTSKKTNM